MLNRFSADLNYHLMVSNVFQIYSWNLFELVSVFKLYMYVYIKLPAESLEKLKNSSLFLPKSLVISHLKF